MKTFRCYLVLAAILAAMGAPASVCWAQAKPRARDLGVPFEGTPGPLDAITDVKGVEVGHTTLISGSGKPLVGQGPVRTGVTAVLPRGKSPGQPSFRWVVFSERQWRDDGDDVGGGIWFSRLI